MDNRAEIREFLTSRRAKITPEQAGVATYGGKRRVPGLRRSEVAQLAGISIEYYTRLERGNLSGASDAVLDALANALKMDDAEHKHLVNLARPSGVGVTVIKRKRSSDEVRPIVQRIVDAMESTPAFVMNGRLDIVASNAMARALYLELYVNATEPANLARFNFLDERSHDLYPEWSAASNTTVALLRAEAGRNPHDRELLSMIGELSTKSDEFRKRWAAHDVRLHRTGVKHLQHSIIGRLDLPFETMEVSGEVGLSLTVYSPEPGSVSEDGLRVLASWAATVHAITAVISDPARG